MLFIHVEGCYRLKFDLIKVNPMSGRLGQYFLFKRFKCFIGYALDNYGDSMRYIGIANGPQKLHIGEGRLQVWKMNVTLWKF